MKLALNNIAISLLAILTLNCGIETPHPQSETVWNGEHYVEDLTFNDIESVCELVTEVWLEIEECIPEHNDSDNDDSTTIKDTNWVAECHEQSDALQIYFLKEHFIHYINNYNSPSTECSSPPPNRLLII